ncbi:Undecaprenyl-diphosphatase [uncultured delta proteobacterium]|uniref:Undecaprenyl-diphosphatase n=1 Tax=uncultured delta proteobacterium TaxID=34034 RepID=A0A212KHQ2_9DELT|nr:Undecaprenyl-diphosphatase [uncultured delta proteobacterium]
MPETLVAVILGIVQGLTEFLPVSSSGHLIITNALIGEDTLRMKTFEVVIQFGSIFAVLLLYRKRFFALLFPSALAGKTAPGGFSGPRGLFLLFLTCLPASILGFFAHDIIKDSLFNPASVALALIVGAVAMLLVERRQSPPAVTTVDGITPRMALCVGLCQCFSLWPGFSRSASTIMGGMLAGARRDVAAEYSFIAAVPIMFAATSFDLYMSFDILKAGDIPFFLLGMAVSLIVALLAIKIFMGLVGRISLRPFAWYRLALAPLVFWALHANAL